MVASEQPPVLNIGRLAPGAAEYYLGEVATSAEDYYVGRGEGEGRWVGSLAAAIGLVGAVKPAPFRAVLEGRHPDTGEHLVRGRSRPPSCERLRNPNQGGLFDDDTLDVARVATRLRLTPGRVRQLLWAGQRARTGPAPVRPAAYLVGTRTAAAGQRGSAPWRVPRLEVERFEAARKQTKRRPGYDLTLRPPKSVSVLWALAAPRRRQVIRDAHRSAVDEVVAYFERHGIYARLGTGDRGRVATAGVIAAAFDHRSSRAGDPLLHTHVVVANLTRTADGKWQAIDGRDVYAHGLSAGYLYQAHLRHRLARDLGIAWGPVRNGYADIDGVPREVVRAFSKRRETIEAAVAEAGYSSPRAYEAATLATRQAKNHGVEATTLADRWRAEADDLGFGSAEVEACFDRADVPAEPDRDEVFAHLGGPAGLTWGRSSFTRGDVVCALAEAYGAAAPAARLDQLADSFLASALVQPLVPRRGPTQVLVWQADGSRTLAPDLARYTTPELIGLEQQVLDWAAHGFAAPAPTTAAAPLARVLARHPGLSEEQQRMVRTLCTSTYSIEPVAGRPGAGKTVAAGVCAEAYLEARTPVIGCAVSAVAAAELESAARLGDRTGRPASTIARLLREIDRDGLPDRCVLLADEGSMVGTRDLVRLSAAVAAVDGAIRIIGDPDQHGPVEAGGLFRRLLADRPGAAHLEANNRQRDAIDRAAIDDYRNDAVTTALARYEAAGKVIRSPSAPACYRAMVGDWLEAVRAGFDDPMIAGTNAARAMLNAWARAALKTDGQLTGPTLVAAGREFAVGDWVVARRNDRFLRSSNTGDFVRNGSAGVVAAVHRSTASLTVAFRAEGYITLPASYLAEGWLEHGYARTTYSMQGATLTRALYHPTDASRFEEGYVALTRGRDHTRIYVVDGTVERDSAVDTAHRGHEPVGTGLDTVSEALERRRTKTLALDADPSAAALGRYRHWDLTALRAERDRLQAIVDGGPPSVGANLDAARRQLDALHARRQAWHATSVAPRRGGLADRVSPSSRQRDRADTQVAAIDRAIVKLSAHVGWLEERQAARDRFLASHAGEREQLDLVRRAEVVAELQLRAGANAAISIETAPRTPEASAAGDDRLEWAGNEPEATLSEHGDDWGAEVNLPC